MRLSSCSNTKERWDMVSQEYVTKSTYARADLYQNFLATCCPKGGDVREFLANLGFKCRS